MKAFATSFVICFATLMTFSIQWDPAPADQQVDRYIVYRAIGVTGEFAILGVTTDATMIDSFVTNHDVHRYGIASMRDDPPDTSTMGCIVRGRVFVVTKIDTIWRNAHHGTCEFGDSMLVVFILPSAPWDVFAIDNNDDYASFGATCDFDFNENGIVDLSDFSFFGESDPDSITMNQFVNMYGKQSRYFPTFRKVTQ